MSLPRCDSQRAWHGMCTSPPGAEAAAAQYLVSPSLARPAPAVLQLLGCSHTPVLHPLLTHRSLFSITSPRQVLQPSPKDVFPSIVLQWLCLNKSVTLQDSSRKWHIIRIHTWPVYHTHSSQGTSGSSPHQVSSLVSQAPAFLNPHLILELLKHQWDFWAKTPYKTKFLFLNPFDASCCSRSRARCK